MKLSVVRSKVVAFPRGYGGTARSQVTEVALELGPGRSVRGWIREGRHASSEDHFMMSSGERLGHKADGNRVGHEVLELAAPNRWWNEIALEVARMDGLKRPVRKHQRWTLKTAPQWLDWEKQRTRK